MTLPLLTTLKPLTSLIPSGSSIFFGIRRRQIFTARLFAGSAACSIFLLSGCGSALDKINQIADSAYDSDSPASAKENPIIDVDNNGELINGIRVNSDGETIGKDSLRVVDRIVLNDIKSNGILDLVQNASYLTIPATATTASSRIDCVSLKNWFLDPRTLPKLAPATQTSQTVTVQTVRSVPGAFTTPTANDVFNFDFNNCPINRGGTTAQAVTGKVQVTVVRFSKADDAVFKVSASSFSNASYPKLLGTRNPSYTLTTKIGSYVLSDYADGSTNFSSLEFKPLELGANNIVLQNINIATGIIKSTLGELKDEPVELSLEGYEAKFNVGPSTFTTPQHKVGLMVTTFTNKRRGYTSIVNSLYSVKFFGKQGTSKEFGGAGQTFALPN
jgi:hypothetical protein